jgi:excisionase family DNA binding protein
MSRNRRPVTISPGSHAVAVSAGLISSKEAARLLGIHFNTLCKWRIRGVGPRFVKAGTAIRYRRSDIETWLQNRTYSNTTEYSGR